MKKFIIFIGVLLFANIQLINQKIEKNSIIISFKIDKKTFSAFQKENVEKITKNLICKNPAAKKLSDKYNIIYNYIFNKTNIKVEVKKGSCNIK